MTMRTYAIEVSHERNTDLDDGLPNTDLLIHFTFVPGIPARGPSYASGGEPPEPAIVEFDRVERMVDGEWIAAPEFADWAAEYLSNGGYDAACEEAEARSWPDPDYALEQMRDDREFGP